MHANFLEMWRQVCFCYYYNYYNICINIISFFTKEENSRNYRNVNKRGVLSQRRQQSSTDTQSTALYPPSLSSPTTHQL